MAVHQTLDLIILVRVQASQPTFWHERSVATRWCPAVAAYWLCMLRAMLRQRLFDAGSCAYLPKGKLRPKPYKSAERACSGLCSVSLDGIGPSITFPFRMLVTEKSNRTRPPTIAAKGTRDSLAKGVFVTSSKGVNRSGSPGERP